jgi:hypothetical protein
MKPHPKVCPACQETFQPQQRNRQTCSDRCRQRLHRQGTENVETLLARWRRQAAAERQSRERLRSAGIDVGAVE